MQRTSEHDTKPVRKTARHCPLLAEYERDTRNHIELVQRFMDVAVTDLTHRSDVHDASKFSDVERLIFARGTASRDRVPYGSPEYHAHMATVKPALDHHYAHNRHHPEHHAGGVPDMNLLDLLEMLADWMAASMKTDNGDPRSVHRAIAINQERFGYSEETARMLHNTARYLLSQKEQQIEN